jgi:hypothetical protein
LYSSDGNNPPRCFISRFRLFRRESGTSYFVNCLPPLIAAEQDGYEISANSEADSGHAAINAFDGNDETKWATEAGDQNNACLKIKLPNATAFTAAYLQARNDGYYYQAPAAFKIQASNDNENWTDLTHESALWIQKEAKIFYWQNETPYLYYRLLVESVQSGTNAGLAEFHLGRRVKIYKKDLNKFVSLVPKMMSNNQDGYVASSSNDFSTSYSAFRAFDGNLSASNKWSTADGYHLNSWLQIELPEAVVANYFTLAAPNEGLRERSPKDFKIQASANGSTWIDLVDESGLSWQSAQVREWKVENSVAYKFYRVFILNTNSGTLADIGEFGIYLKSVVKEY